MKPAEALSKAADLIEERGLARGAFVDRDGCLCTLGAILVACGATVNVGDRDFPFLSELRDAKVEAAPARRVFATYIAQGIPSWNDARTQPEVVAALRAAAERAA